MFLICTLYNKYSLLFSPESLLVQILRQIFIENSENITKHLWSNECKANNIHKSYNFQLYTSHYG